MLQSLFPEVSIIYSIVKKIFSFYGFHGVIKPEISAVVCTFTGPHLFISSLNSLRSSNFLAIYFSCQGLDFPTTNLEEPPLFGCLFSMHNYIHMYRLCSVAPCHLQIRRGTPKQHILFLVLRFNLLNKRCQLKTNSCVPLSCISYLGLFRVSHRCFKSLKVMRVPL